MASLMIIMNGKGKRLTPRGMLRLESPLPMSLHASVLALLKPPGLSSTLALPLLILSCCMST